ncbi:MAG: hypothetical protein P8M16_08945 [Acidimicrobiales bacterium]|nr:hypothetical protein [Acidimicrobiales bacterium]
MHIRKLSSTNAFVAIDLADAPGHGVVRCAPKILQGGAKELARSSTYALALLERRETGISAGISATVDDRDTAVSAFASEVADWDGGYRLIAAKGVDAGSLGAIEQIHNPALLAAGAVAAGLAACPDAKTAVVDSSGGPELLEELAARGLTVTVTEQPLTTEADLLFIGFKVGAIDHGAADMLRVRAVVPIGPLPLTTKAVAHCHRNGVLALPDFVTTAGTLLDNATDARDAIATIVTAVVDHDDGPVLGACERAEAFLASWQSELPFGRPMAA